MILGKMEKALKNNQIREKSSGRQLREFHHVDDDAHAILSPIERTDIRGFQNLSYGNARMIREIVREVMD